MKFDIQFFAMNEPNFHENAKQIVKDKYLQSRFRTNTLERAKIFDAETRKQLTPESAIDFSWEEYNSGGMDYLRLVGM